MAGRFKARRGNKYVKRNKAAFPFGSAAQSQGFPFGASQGYFSGIASGGGFGWAITFVVIFFIAIVFWYVWRGLSPVFGGGYGGLGALGGLGTFFF